MMNMATRSNLQPLSYSCLVGGVKRGISAIYSSPIFSGSTNFGNFYCFFVVHGFCGYFTRFLFISVYARSYLMWETVYKRNYNRTKEQKATKRRMAKITETTKRTERNILTTLEKNRRH